MSESPGIESLRYVHVSDIWVSTKLTAAAVLPHKLDHNYPIFLT